MVLSDKINSYWHFLDRVCSLLFPNKTLQRLYFVFKNNHQKSHYTFKTFIFLSMCYYDFKNYKYHLKLNKTTLNHLVNKNDVIEDRPSCWTISFNSENCKSLSEELETKTIFEYFESGNFKSVLLRIGPRFGEIKSHSQNETELK
jgi:hypothetical protein